jgi:ATP-binding cassette subfamily B protein
VPTGRVAKVALTPEMLAQVKAAAAAARTRASQDGDGGAGEDDEKVPPPKPDFVKLMGLEGPPAKQEWHRLPRMVVLAFRLVCRAAKGRAVVLAVLQAITGLGIGAQLLAGNSLLQEAITIRGSGGDIADLAPQALTIGVISAVLAVAGAISTTQQPIVTELVGTHAYDEIMQTSAAVDLVQFEDSSFFDRLQRAAAGALFRPWMLTSGVLSMGASVLGLVGIGFALATLQPLLLALAVASSIPVWLATTRNAKGAFRVDAGNTPDDRERRYLRDLLTTREPAKEVRAFNLVGYLQSRHRATTERIIARQRMEARKQLLRMLGGRLGAGMGAVASGGVLLWLLVSERLTIAAAVTAAVAMQQLRSRINGVATGASSIFEAALYLDDYAAFIAMRPSEGDGARAQTQPGAKPRPAPFRRLVAEGVTFTYPGAAQPALDGVDVEIPAGRVVALVGENGSGKTTLAKLLCGLYHPTLGRVTWDGVDVRDLDGYGVRDHVAVIFQDFIRYVLPARDNVGLGRHERIDDDEGIRAAARLAGVDGTFNQLAEGWDTVLGREFFGGQDLSGGQWQRVALARAFFRDAPFLVLDEPTAALDARAEFRLFERLRELARGRSVLLITHRFGNVRMADHIYVLHKGRVEESGSHEELLANGGRYAELFGLQAAQLLGLGDDDTVSSGQPPA